jgi:glycosyltransferase involved in cell wall biosynthesis
LPDLWSKVSGFGRFVLRLRRLVNEPTTLDEATACIRDGVARRDERFLAMLARVVTPNPRSPYRQLLASAGCGAEDVAALVARDGLEEALTSLVRAGVYVSYDEFKCLSRVYQEAQACAKTLLASDIPGAREVVRHGETGLLFQKADIDDQAEKTLLAGDSALRARIGRQARQYVERYHDIDRAVDQYMALLQLQCER